jgi:glutamate-1-semialdehyde aminotransferase
VLGGGTTIGALGCKDYLLTNLLNASPPLRLGGTFSGNPMSMAATNAVLDLSLDRSGFSFDSLADKCSRFARTLNEKLRNNKLPAYVSHVGSMFFVHMNNPDCLHPRDLQKEDMKKLDELCLRLRINGVYTENAHTAFFSFAHGDEIVDELIEIFFRCITECFDTDAH